MFLDVSKLVNEVLAKKQILHHEWGIDSDLVSHVVVAYTVFFPVQFLWCLNFWANDAAFHLYKHLKNFLSLSAYFHTLFWSFGRSAMSAETDWS